MYITDDFGNEITFTDQSKIFLKLVAEDRPRSIGALDIHNNYIKTGMIEDKHLFRLNESWGLNYSVLEIIGKMNPDAKIYIYSDKGNYCITLFEALAYGSFLMFKGQGFERQLFVEKKYWNEIQNG